MPVRLRGRGDPLKGDDGMIGPRSPAGACNPVRTGRERDETTIEGAPGAATSARRSVREDTNEPLGIDGVVGVIAVVGMGVGKASKVDVKISCDYHRGVVADDAMNRIEDGAPSLCGVIGPQVHVDNGVPLPSAVCVHRANGMSRDKFAA